MRGGRIGLGAVLLGLLFLSVVKPGTAVFNCDPAWRHFEGSCYLFSLVAQNWDAARHDCLGRYGDMAKVQNASVNHYFKDRQDRELKKSELWLGLNDRQTNGTFLWSDGTPLNPGDFNNWIGAHPADRPAGHCVAMYGTWTEQEKLGQWYAASCNPTSRKLFVCQSLPPEDPWIKDHADCGRGWYLDPDTDQCYLLEQQPLEWGQAWRRCNSSSSAHLVTVTSTPQQLFLNRLTGRLGLTDTVWLGAQGLANGSLQWADPSTPDAFHHFHPHESLPSVEDKCLTMKTGDSTSFWGTESCSTTTRRSLCQKQARNSDRCGADGTWRVFTNLCYKVFPAQTWQAARAACLSSGGTLAMVKTHPQYDFVYDLLRLGLASSEPDQQAAWLGLTLRANAVAGGNFMWEDDTPLADSLQYWHRSFEESDRTRLDGLLNSGASCVGLNISTYIRLTESLQIPRLCNLSLPFVCQKLPTFTRPPLRATGPAANVTESETKPPGWEVPTRPPDVTYPPSGYDPHSAIVGQIVGSVVGPIAIIALVVGVSLFLKYKLPELPENHVIRRSIRRLSMRRRSGRRQAQKYGDSFVELGAVNSGFSPGSDDPAQTSSSDVMGNGGEKNVIARNGDVKSNGHPRGGFHPSRGGGREGNAYVKNDDVIKTGEVGGRDVRDRDVRAAGGGDVTERPAGPRARHDLSPPAIETQHSPSYMPAYDKAPPSGHRPPGSNVQGETGAQAHARSPRGNMPAGDVRMPGGNAPGDVRMQGGNAPGDVRMQGGNAPGDVRMQQQRNSRPRGDDRMQTGHAGPPDVRTPRSNPPGDVRMPRNDAPRDVRMQQPNVGPGDGRMQQGPPGAPDVRMQQRSNAPGDPRMQRNNPPGDVRMQQRNVGPGDGRMQQGPPGPPDVRTQHSNAPGDPRMQRHNPPGDVRMQQRNARPGDVRMQQGNTGPPDVRTQRSNAPADVRTQRGNAPGDPRMQQRYNSSGDVRMPGGAGPGDVRMQRNMGPGDVRGRPADVRPDVRPHDPRRGHDGAHPGTGRDGGGYPGPRSQNV